MRQNDSNQNLGQEPGATQPGTSTATNLFTLASSLKAIHPADIISGAQALAVFACAEMKEVDFTAGHGTNSTTEELAATILAVLRNSPKEFAGVLPLYGKLLDMVNTFCYEITEGAYQGFGPAEFKAAHLVCAELDRIELNLGTKGEAKPYIDAVQPVPLRLIWRNWCYWAAATCVALLIFDISRDGLLLWQIATAFCLVLVIAGLAFRIGRLQTPVPPTLWAEGKVPVGKAGR